MFPEGSVAFDHALIMRDVRHEWHGVPDLTIDPAVQRREDVPNTATQTAGIWELMAASESAGLRLRWFESRSATTSFKRRKARKKRSNWTGRNSRFVEANEVRDPRIVETAGRLQNESAYG
jgi:hypothetical protein